MEKEEKKSLLGEEKVVKVDVHAAKRKGTAPSHGGGRYGHDYPGLTSSEARQKLVEYGPNSVEEKTTPLWRLFLSKFIGPMEILIEIAIILSLLNAIFSPQHDYVSFFVLVALLLINGLIGFIEERNAGKAIAALKKSLAPKCSCKRDGQWQVIDAKDLVPGDLITMKLGDIVPADSELSTASGTIESDESSLTGESLPVTVYPGEVAKASSIIRKGEVEAVVVATGKNTYIGEAMSLVAQSNATEGRFQKVLLDVAKACIVASLACAVIIFAVKVFKDHQKVLPILDLCLVLLVASIPITMQVVCTGTLAVGSRRLAEHSVVVSRLGAIEELAGMTVLCSDKTGTLTQNKLQMRDPWVASKSIDGNELTFLGGLAAKRVNPDAIDFCIINALPNKAELDKYQEMAFVPFDPISKRTEATVKSPKGNIFKVTKGAPQVILDMSDNKPEVEEAVDQMVKEYAERGLRSLGVAKCEITNAKGEKFPTEKWEFLGMLSCFDPPRVDTKQTIEKAIAMGSEVKMITGDHLLIAKETARLLGMGQAFYGKDFLAAVDEGKAIIDGVDVSDIVEAADGFAQVAPKHKYFIVDVLQKRGHVTGMTGDGVNDAPALKKANIGIAVEGATEAAKAASDIVLLTPGLSVIITGIIRSRKIFQRMKNYCIYRITCTIQLLLFFFIAIIFMDFSIPALCLVFLTLLNDGTVLSISYDKVIPSKKPEDWKLGVITGISVVVGLFITLGLFAMYYLFLSPVSGSHNLFGYRFDELCFYSVGPFPETIYSNKVLDHAICNPLCPTVSEDLKSCGATVGWSEMMTVIYLSLSVGGQLTVFVSRTRHSFWSRRPGYALAIACLGAQIVATLISVYLPVSLKVDSYVGVTINDKDYSVEVIMKGIDWKMAGWVWVVSIIVFIISDFAKVYAYFALDNENKPDIDIQEIKKTKRPFLPSLGREDKKSYEKKEQRQRTATLIDLP